MGGRQVEGYELFESLGQGAAGTVYRAAGPDGRPVAVKLLNKLDAHGAARFDREKRLLASLGEADGFVGMLGAGVTQGVPYIVMPLVPGGTLRHRLARGPLSLGEAVSVVGAIAAALGRAHARGILHRDLKPENILFSGSGRPLVADLGLGKFLDAEESTGASAHLSRTGELRGTVGYMAPEQARGERAVGPTADVYALGTILYECLAGETPFSGESLIEVLGKAASMEAPPVERLRGDTPPWLAAVVKRALARDPRKRFLDAGALAEALRGKRRAPSLVPGLAILSVIGVAVAFALARRSTDGRADPTVAAPRSSTNTARVTSGVPAARPHAGPRTSAPLALRDHPRLPPLEPSWGTSGACQGSMVNEVALSPRGDLVASAGLEGFVFLWDAETGEEVASLETRGRAIETLAFSPDGARLYGAESGGPPACVLVWDTATFARVGAIEELANTTGPLRVSREGVLLRGSNEGAVAWDPAARTLARPGPRRRVAKTCWADDARAALLLEEDGTLTIRGAKSGLERTVKTNARVLAFAATRDARRALEGDETGTVSCWDLEAGRELWRRSIVPESARPLPRELVWVRTAAIARDAAVGVCGGGDGTLHVFDLALGVERLRLRGHRLSWVQSVDVSADGSFAVSGGNDGTVRGWDVVSGVERWRRTGHAGAVMAVGPVSGGRALSGGIDGAVLLWDERRTDPVRVLASRGEPVTAVVATQDGERAVWTDGARVFATSLDREEEPRPIAEAGGVSIHTLQAVGRSSVLVAGTARSGMKQVNAVAVHDFAGAGSVPWLTFGDATGRAAAVSIAEGTRVLFAGGVYAVEWLDVPSGRTGRIVVPGSGRIVALVALATGERVLAVSDDGTLRVLRLDGAGAPAVVRTGQRGLASVTASPDGTRVAMVGPDGALSLWSVETGEQLDARDLAPVHDYARGVAFGASGEWLAVGTLRGAIFRFAANR